MTRPADGLVDWKRTLRTGVLRILNRWAYSGNIAVQNFLNFAVLVDAAFHPTIKTKKSLPMILPAGGGGIRTRVRRPTIAIRPPLCPQ